MVWTIINILLQGWCSKNGTSKLDLLFWSAAGGSGGFGGYLHATCFGFLLRFSLCSLTVGSAQCVFFVRVFFLLIGGGRDSLSLTTFFRKDGGLLDKFQPSWFSEDLLLSSDCQLSFWAIPFSSSYKIVKLPHLWWCCGDDADKDEAIFAQKAIF